MPIEVRRLALEHRWVVGVDRNALEVSLAVAVQDRAAVHIKGPAIVVGSFPAAHPIERHAAPEPRHMGENIGFRRADTTEPAPRLRRTPFPPPARPGPGRCCDMLREDGLFVRAP